jgi:ABC-type polysaccharide/polyol phosphate export permease
MIKFIFAAIADIKKSLLIKHVWTNLAILEIKSSYKRTILGPFWIVITTFVLIFAMGPLYSYIFKIKFEDYFLYIVCGFTFWEFIKQNILEATKIFPESNGIILSQPFPISLYIFKSLYKNIIIFLHNLIVVIPTVFFFNNNISFNTFFFFTIGAAINCITIFFLSLIISIICTRYKDMAQIIVSILTVMFFLTPILWTVDMAGERAFFVYGNIFFIMIDVIRLPLISSNIPVNSLIALVALNLIIIPLSLYIFGKFKSKIAYWV